MDWPDQLAVVTGGSSGIGRAIATAFAERVQHVLGTPTILVNNAGIGRFAPVVDMSTEDWDAVFATNLRGMFLVTRAFLPAMLAAGRGAIVNIASLAAKNAFAGGAAYAASKHGVLGFSKSLLLEVRQRGLRVIAVCPGSGTRRSSTARRRSIPTGSAFLGPPTWPRPWCRPSRWIRARRCRRSRSGRPTRSDRTVRTAVLRTTSPCL